MARSVEEVEEAEEEADACLAFQGRRTGLP